MDCALASTLLWGLVLLGPVPAKDPLVVPFGEEPYRVWVGELGALHALPPEGGTTRDGPRHELASDLEEWVGVAFTTSQGRVEGVGLGRSPDFAQRTLVQPQRVFVREDGLRVVTSLGELELVHHFRFDESAPRLLVTTWLENRGSEVLRDVFVSREWRVDETDAGTSPVDLDDGNCPADVARVLWMQDDLAPGARTAVTFSYDLGGDAGIRADDVPLVEWKGGSWTNGLATGGSFGISLADYDRDGFVDFFNAKSAELFHNDAGLDWTLYTDVQQVLDKVALRYGSSIGDYDADGLPDIGTEPRQSSTDKPFHLLKNLGGGPNFVDVSTDPNIVDVVPFGDAETMCWADTDFDGDLDAFLPVYPPWASGGPGNWFLQNLGPTGPGNAYRFSERSGPVGLDNPQNSARPEGAEFCDVDSDGDLEIYSNGTLYLNESAFDAPSFADLSETDSGIVFSTDYDEGATLFDHDLDGDFDLAVAYCAGDHGVRIFENDGDGTFTITRQGLVESFRTGLCLGMSKADFDGDGDIDFTTRDVFRKNLLVETGDRGFVVASHSIPPQHLSSATPAWFDWDKDGDLDCMLGNYGTASHFYESTLYDPNTPRAERRDVRVRVLRDADVFDGLETEFGAAAEIVVRTASDDLRRRSFVSSSGGYLNQNEATLHFFLPPDPTPGDDSTDHRFDVVVDFVADPALGPWRVDRRVNPELGDLSLAELEDREITVYRSGAVVVDGCRFEPVAGNEARLVDTGTLAKVGQGQPLADPVPAPASDWYVGLDFDTFAATGPLFLKELWIDGTLSASSVDCSGTAAKIAVWDVSTPGAPLLVEDGLATGKKFGRNHRTPYALSTALKPGRRYRVVARVDDLRQSTITAPFAAGPLTVNGGLSFADLDPCSGVNVDAAVLDPTLASIALRVALDSGDLWADLGYGTAGTSGVPSLTARGRFEPGERVSLDLMNAAPNRPGLLVPGSSVLCVPLGAGTLLPFPDFLVPIHTDATGAWSLFGTVPGTLGRGETGYFQALVADPAAAGGVVFSNALSGTSRF